MTVIIFTETEIGISPNESFTMAVKPYDGGGELALGVRAGDGDSLGDFKVKFTFLPEVSESKRVIKALQHAERAVRAWQRQRRKESF